MIKSRQFFLFIFIFILGILVGSLAMFLATRTNTSRVIIPEGTKTCEYQGKIFQAGESLKIDKCNSCTCDGGQISCTTMACEP